jgi:hypothetical protein
MRRLFRGLMLDGLVEVTVAMGLRRYRLPEGRSMFDGLGASPAGCLGLRQFQRLTSATLVDNRDVRRVSVICQMQQVCIECSTLGAWSMHSKVAVVAAPSTSGSSQTS